MAIPVDTSILRRVRSELGNGVEYRIGVFTKITSVSTVASTQVLRQDTPITGYWSIWFHVLGFSDQENSAEQRFEFQRADHAIPKYAQIFVEAGSELGEAFMCNLKTDLFSDIPLQMSDLNRMFDFGSINPFLQTFHKKPMSKASALNPL